MNNQKLKNEVRAYWDKASCGTQAAVSEKYSQHYFNEIEEYRYSIEPIIFSFAQFTRFRQKKVLEVGVGAGTDFIQWARSGAYCYGIDLTQEAIDNTRARLALEHLKADHLSVADAEKLPFLSEQFDLVYSWGVIHHSPDMQQCLQEMIRVTKVGGTIKVMLYHRHSLFALYRYFLAGLLKRKPFQSITQVLYSHQESIGTKAYTFKEIKQILACYPVKIKHLSAPATSHDLLFYKSKIWQWLAYCAAAIGGINKVGWFMLIEVEKIQS